MITSQPELQEEIDHIFVSVDELENVVVGGEGDEGDEKDEEKKKAKRKLNLIAKNFVDLKYTTGGLLVVTVYLNFVFFSPPLFDCNHTSLVIMFFSH